MPSRSTLDFPSTLLSPAGVERASVNPEPVNPAIALSQQLKTVPFKVVVGQMTLAPVAMFFVALLASLVARHDISPTHIAIWIGAMGVVELTRWQHLRFRIERWGDLDRALRIYAPSER